MLKNGGSFKTAKRKLALGEDRTYALKDKRITHNMDEVMKVAERFKLCASNVRPGDGTKTTNLARGVPLVTK